MEIDKRITKYILCNMKVITSIKLDKQVKEDASKLANEIGISLSSIINATLKQFVNEGRVSFSIEPEFNEKTKKKFLRLLDDVEKNKNLSKAYTNSEDLFKALEI